MKTARLQIIICFFLTVSVIVTYKVLTSSLLDANLRQARLAYETEKLRVEQARLRRYDALEAKRFQVKRANLQRDSNLQFYGAVGFLSACGLSLLILAIGYSRAKVKRASVHTTRIGQHSEIPIHQKDLQQFYPIAVNLSLAEIEASVSTAHETAYRISRQMIDDITDYTRALAGKRGMLVGGSGQPELPLLDAPLLTATPTFADLLRNGTLAPGKPLVFGYDRQGQPQYRSLQDLKSVAIAGWQGSGKTLSTGYLVASSVLTAGVRAYIVDPHRQHPESLSRLIAPLEHTGQVTIINPFDTPALIDDLNHTLDRRLAGEEVNASGILLVIDELARLAKMACFDTLMAFLERCTEETRKANITFIGGSHKWTARHFKGRADIRGCMNSMLIHKTKPSQADLLLEDAHDKHLVKQLHHPGEAILVTDYDTPTVVSIPFCNRKDMETVADMISNMKASARPAHEAQIVVTGSGDMRHDLSFKTPAMLQPDRGTGESSSLSPKPSTSETTESTDNTPSSEVISLARHRKISQTTPQAVFEPKQLTVEMVQAQLQRRKAQDATFTQAEVAKRAGMSQSYLSRILNGQCPLSDKHKHKLYEILFDNEGTNMLDRSRSSFWSWGLRNATAR
jgi:hypothetical protein